MIVKEHWLYGKCKFKVEVIKEESCEDCIHIEVCKMDMERFCENYEFGTSQFSGCDGCIHRFTRYYGEEERIPCKKCRFFLRKGLVI